MQKGDIVLVPFPFTNLRQSKKRPVLVVGNLAVTVCFISTQLHWEEKEDLIVEPEKSNGLKKK